MLRDVALVNSSTKEVSKAELNQLVLVCITELENYLTLRLSLTKLASRKVSRERL